MVRKKIKKLFYRLYWENNGIVLEITNNIYRLIFFSFSICMWKICKTFKCIVKNVSLKDN